ncbi:hypothetical protein [Desulfotomaculum sp. 1211_IL3151]|uniref:hypothetical protein n=1 Tax=Desulfotomaculum sp. 1211_IL3151 TaxID=3084055 RepID=UPI002FDB28AB
MSAFDKNEKTIHDALSQITVDASQIKSKVQSRLHEETFCGADPRRVRWANSMVAVIALSAMLVVTAAAAAAALGGFDWFIQKFNPSFSEVVEPVEISSEDQGIRMEVIGAQKYGNKAVVYLSLQDISGQNRLTEQTDFRDGFRVAMDPPDRGTGQADEVTASFSWKQNLLFFDEETNTLYYEFNITADVDSPLSDPLELGTSRIYFSKREYEEPVSVSLGGLDGAQVTPIVKNQIWGGRDVPDDLSGITAALTPGHYAALAHGEDDQWISNIGIVDGKLHVQIGKIFGKEFGNIDATLVLRTPDGQFITPDYELTLFGDEDRRLLDSGTASYSEAAYKYNEAIFSINTDELDDCTLYYNSAVYSGVEGRWKVAANLSDTSRQTRMWTNDVLVEGHLFEYLTLSPLGLEIRGSYEGEECLASEMTLEIETMDGIIPLEGGGGSLNYQEQTFNLHWDTESPVDVTTVTAVMINGTRIPVKGR